MGQCSGMTPDADRNDRDEGGSTKLGSDYGRTSQEYSGLDTPSAFIVGVRAV